jgi:microcystin-dependent protein
MPVEIATFIADLVATNPPTSDLETQGANHLQLIKSVLQNVFGTSVRRFVGLPTSSAINASGALTINAANTTFYVNTGAGAVTITLPAGLAVSDDGWECSFIKSTFDANPILFAPPSGTLQSGEYGGLSLARRCIPGRRTRCIWNGTAFFLERTMSQPVGAMIPYTASKTLPPGFEWPNGQVLSSSANYPEYFALFGSGNTVDMRGRAAFGQDDMGGVAAGRISVAGLNFDGTVLNNAGGAQLHTLTLAEAPTGQFTFNDASHSHAASSNFPGLGSTGGFNGGNAGSFSQNTQTITVNTNTTGASITDHAGGGAHTILPPALTCPHLLVVE